METTNEGHPEQPNGDEEVLINFKFMHDRVTHPISHVRWCSTMDLLALCYAQNNQIHIYRPSNFQRLHTIQPSQLSNHNTDNETVVNDICWSSDGFLLAIASSNSESSGSLDLLDLESGSIVFSITGKNHSYQKLYWMAHSDFVDNVQSCVSSLKQQITLSALPLLELPDPGSIASGFSELPLEIRHHALLKPMSSLHILIALSTSNIAEFYAMGTMHIMSVDLSSLIMYGERITNLAFSVNFEQLLIFKEDQDGINTLCTVNLDSVFNRKNCESIISDYNHYIHIHDILCNNIESKSIPPANNTVKYYSSRIGECIQYIHSQWEQFFTKQFMPLFEQLYNYMKQEAITISGVFDLNSIFATILVSGTVDHPTLQWLSIHANDNNLTKLIRQLQQTQQTLTLYLTDHIQRYTEHLILRLSKVSSDINSELLRATEALHTLSHQLLTLICSNIHDVDNFLEFLRHIHVKVCGKPKQRQQQLAQQVAPLPMRPLDMKLVMKFLRSDWTTDNCLPLIQKLGKQHQELAELFLATFDHRANSLSLDISKSLFSRVTLVQIPENQVLCLKACKDRSQLLVGQLKDGAEGEQYLQLLKLSLNSHPIEMQYVHIAVPSGFFVEWANFYGEDQVFILIRHEETMQKNDENGSTEPVSLHMITCSFADSTWIPFDGTATDSEHACILPEDMQMSKQRSFLHEGKLQNVDIMDGKICLGCIVLELSPPGDDIKRLCIFDMEEDE